MPRMGEVKDSRRRTSAQEADESTMEALLRAHRLCSAALRTLSRARYRSVTSAESNQASPKYV